jgi:hypothetical protein
VTMNSFAGVLANQLINTVDRLLSFFSPLLQELRSLTEASANITVSNESQESISSTSTLTTEQLALSLRVLTDSNGLEHHQIADEVGVGSTGKRRTKTRPCAICLKDNNKRRLGYGCFTCGIALCCLAKINLERDCFEHHVESICRRSDRQT